MAAETAAMIVKILRIFLKVSISKVLLEVIPKDTIKVKGEDNFSIQTLKRDELVAVQTPQAFDFKHIYKYHKLIKEKKNINNKSITDTVAADAASVQLNGNGNQQHFALSVRF